MDKNNGEALTGIKKRQQINAANKAVFAWIAVASLVIGVCGVFAQFLIRQLIFNNTVYGTLVTTRSTLEKNIDAYDSLKSGVSKLVADSSLNALRNGENSTALQVIIDALPTEENRASFATSMQTKVLGPTGVIINSFSVIGSEADLSVATTTVSGTSASAFDFTFSITGNYSQIKQAIQNMERSIRPITVQSIAVQGTSEKLEANVTATTYYQPARGIELNEVEKKP